MEPLWSQQGNAGDLIWGIVVFLCIISYAVKAVLEANAQARGNRLAEQQRLQREAEAAGAKPSPEKKTVRRPPAVYEYDPEEERTRKVLSRELAPQGEGARFEAAPGTMDETQLVSPSIESTVKPTLESMTGIYEAKPTESELGGQPLTLDIQKLIARPEGIRQAVILAEILKRPEF